MTEKYYVGIDLGGTNIAAGLVSEDGKIIAKKSVKTGSDRPFKDIIKDMAGCVLSVIEENGVTLDEIISVGIGTPGSVDSENGVLIYANNFSEKENIKMREMLQSYIDKPVYMTNDANAAALGEVVAGAAKGYNNAIVITLGTGVGGGVIINGKLYEGQYSAGAELGHIMLMHGGEPCSCGRHGCWEAYASATALIRQTKRAMKENPDSYMNKIASLDKVSGRTAFTAAKEGDEAGKKVVEKYIEYIGEGLVDIINIFRPEILIIGGGICNEGEYLLRPLREFLRKYSYGGDLHPEQKLATAALGNDAGIIGAAFLGKK